MSAEQATAVDAMAARAAAADGFDPLNEEARFSRASGDARHLLATESDELVGYLVHSPVHQTSQLVVDPAYRRRGIGSRLVAALGADAPPRLWAFHDAPPAQGFVRQLGLVEGRALLVMEKPLSPEGIGGPRGYLQDGVHLRGYVPEDAAALLAVNAAAFAHHPEQGRLDAAGLAARMNEEWFDPDGLIVAVENGRMLGFHWTKRAGDLGEVYVVGVDPAAQGRGLGRRLLQAGLDHLAKTGCSSVILYVDSADTVAVGMYLSAGFGVAHRDVLYVPAPEEQR
ncbi:MAG: mycothiol synthase [Propionibacteriaceae bacterium]|nr:mycothiol synthase [Propionibacteriaceae bacterium]